MPQQFRIKNGLIIDNGGIAVTGSISSTAGITGSFSGSIAGFPTDVAAFSSSLSSRIASNEAKTGSYATTGSNQFNGSQTITGSLTATGTIVAQTLVVQTITSSVEFVTGSNRFGTTTGNTHEFTGSLLVSGSQNINGNVGIGTTTPTGSNMSNLLHVAGTSAVLRVGPFYAGAERDFIELIASGTDTKVTSPNERFWIENTAGSIIISASSGVGIGTTNPIYALDVHSNQSAYTSRFYQPSSVTSSYNAVIWSGAHTPVVGYVTTGGSAASNAFLQSNMGVGTQNAYGLMFVTNDTGRMYINSSGNIGIGTTAPLTSLGKTLTVIGTGIFQNSAGGGSYNENLRLNRSTGNLYAAIALGGAYDSTSGTGVGQWTLVSTPAASSYAFDFDYNGATVIKFSTAGAATFNSSVTATQLNLSNTDGYLGTINSTAGNGAYFAWQTSGTTIADIGTAQQIFGSGGSTTFGINARGSRDLAFGANNTERMRITSGGLIGIGTTSPTSQAKVHIVGQGSDYGIQIDSALSNTGGSDNLFIRNTSSGNYVSIGLSANGSDGQHHRAVLKAIKDPINSGNAAGIFQLDVRNTSATYTTALAANALGYIGIGTTNPSSKLSLGTGVGKKLLVYDNPSTGVYSGLGQDLAAGNSTDFFAHGYGGLGYLSFGKLGTDGSTYTEWAKITTQGVLQLNSSNSPGLRFANGATNLNYYEQGSWTPSLGNATVSYSDRSGTYVRIGDYVFVRWGFRISSISGQSGTVTISGLPFAAVNWGSYQEPNISVSTGNLATADNAQRARVFIGGSGTVLYGRIANNGDTTWNTSDLQNGSWIIGEIFYNVP